MSKRIHICYTIPNFDTAGSGKVVYDLAKNVDPCKFRVSIACRHNKGEFFKEVENLGIPIHIISYKVPLRPYHNLLLRLKPFLKFIKTHQVDIVHSWDWSSNWSEALTCRIAGIPFVYTKKSMAWGNIHWKIKSYLSNTIITVNDKMPSLFKYKRRQKLIPFGLDTDFYKPALFSMSSSKDLFQIITVANLVPVKGIEVLIKAIKRVEPSIVLKIVGDMRDPYAETLKGLVLDLKLDDRIFFLGQKADVRSLLQDSDLYVISSKKEGMPMALVEAMSMGIPVLGSDIAGVRYVLKDFEDLLFPVLDSEVLAKKINQVYNLSFQDRNVLGESLREYCLSNFNMPQFINKHETLYWDIINAT